MGQVRIIVVDELELVARGVVSHLSGAPEMKVVGHVATGKALLGALWSIPAELALVDISLAEMDGIDTTRLLRAHFPGLKVLAHSTLSDIEYVNSMLIEGAAGYVVKNGPDGELALAIRCIMAGGTYLSAAAKASIAQGYRYTAKHMGSDYIGLTLREREIIRLVALEYSNGEIAFALGISEGTVKTHRKNLMGKINVRSVAGLVKYAVDRRWV